MQDYGRVDGVEQQVILQGIHVMEEAASTGQMPSDQPSIAAYWLHSLPKGLDCRAGLGNGGQ
jgi:hypothetical protein